MRVCFGSCCDVSREYLDQDLVLTDVLRSLPPLNLIYDLLAVLSPLIYVLGKVLLQIDYVVGARYSLVFTIALLESLEKVTKVLRDLDAVVVGLDELRVSHEDVVGRQEIAIGHSLQEDGAELADRGALVNVQVLNLLLRYSLEVEYFLGQREPRRSQVKDVKQRVRENLAVVLVPLLMVLAFLPQLRERIFIQLALLAGQSPALLAGVDVLVERVVALKPG